ncbi:AfsR/SARP family transcriptional regulator, partial [Plantactinospora sp. S1510]
MSYEFRLLGPLEVHHHGRPLTVAGAKRRLLLLSLLLHLNRPVSLEWLRDALWDVQPPVSATSNIRGYVMSLRQQIAHPDEVQIVTCGNGYQLVAPAAYVDLTEFDSLTRYGRNAMAQGEFSGAARAFDAALALWRGPVGDGASPGKALENRLLVLVEQRMTTREDLAEARLALGQLAEVIADLRILVADEPLRERAWAQLIRALYASGDTAGALAAHSAARSLLVDRLGLEPGHELRDIQQAILRRDPELARARVRMASPPAPPEIREPVE